MASTTYTNVLTRGTKATLPSPSDGKIRLATDSQQLFIDYGNSRIEITDYVKGYMTSQILAIQSPLDKVYMSSDNFDFYYYDKIAHTWKCVFGAHATYTTSQIIDLESTPFVTIDNIDTTDGLDFGDEDELIEEEEVL